MDVITIVCWVGVGIVLGTMLWEALFGYEPEGGYVEYEPKHYYIIDSKTNKPVEVNLDKFVAMYIAIQESKK